MARSFHSLALLVSTAAFAAASYIGAAVRYASAWLTNRVTGYWLEAVAAVGRAEDGHGFAKAPKVHPGLTAREAHYERSTPSRARPTHRTHAALFAGAS